MFNYIHSTINIGIAMIESNMILSELFDLIELDPDIIDDLKQPADQMVLIRIKRCVNCLHLNY